MNPQAELSLDLVNRKRFKHVDLSSVVHQIEFLQRSNQKVSTELIAGFIGYSASYTYKILHYLRTYGVVEHIPYQGWRVHTVKKSGENTT